MAGGARTPAPPSGVSGLAPALGRGDLCLSKDDPVDAQEVGTISVTTSQTSSYSGAKPGENGNNLLKFELRVPVWPLSERFSYQSRCNLVHYLSISP